MDLRGSLGGDDSLGAMFTNQFYSSESECGKFSQYESKPLYEIVRLVNQKARGRGMGSGRDKLVLVGMVEIVGVVRGVAGIS